MHKMKAFVRFRAVDDGDGDGAAACRLVRARAPHRRGGRAVLRAPLRADALGDPHARAQRALGRRARSRSAPARGATRRRRPTPASALWLTYYQHIFNPARLKLAMMQREMPRRYWHNLPEARADRAARRRSRRTEQRTWSSRRPTDAGAPSPGRSRADRADQPVPIVERADVAAATCAQALDRCRECPIGEHATQAVPGEGPMRRAPDVRRRAAGRPGRPARPALRRPGRPAARPRAGRARLAARAAYVTNAVKHFKFELRGKRRIHKTPAQQEAAACLHWLESEIALVQPAGAGRARRDRGAPAARPARSR